MDQTQSRDNSGLDEQQTNHKGGEETQCKALTSAIKPRYISMAGLTAFLMLEYPKVTLCCPEIPRVPNGD